MRAQPRATAVDDGLVDFSEYLRILARRKWLVLFGVLLGALAGVLFYHHQGKSFTSTARVQVKQITTNPNALGAGKVDIATEQQIAASPVVAGLVAQKLKSPRKPGQLLAGLTVTAPAKSDTLLLKYSAATKKGAQAAAQAFADSYLAYSRLQAAGRVAAATKTYQDRLNKLQPELLKVDATLATAAKGSTEYNSATALRNSLTQQISSLRTRIDDLGSIIIDPGSVIGAATLPTQPDGFGVPLYLVGGAVIGLVLFILLAFLRDRGDDRLHAAEDVERQVGLPLIGSLPTASGRNGRLRQLPVLGALPGRHTPNGRQRDFENAPPELQEAYGAMLARLHVAARENRRLVMVSSPLDHREATVTAANLAVALARSDQRVALVVADQSDSAVDWLLESSGLQRTGPGETMSDGAGRLRSRIPALEVVLPPAAAQNARHYVNPQRMHSLLQDLRKSQDYVIVAAPPVLISADALMLATAVDSVLLVAAQGRATRSDIAEAAQQLSGVGAHLLGVVVSGGRLSRDRRSRLRRHHRDSLPAVPAIGGSAGEERSPSPRVLQSS